MHLEPQYTLALVYQLTDPSDGNTYYVRAVLRNSLTGATIQTVNLTQSTGGRFTGSTLTPKDPTGLGFFMDVTITVYTDSGYTTLSDVYRRETTTYLVRRAQQAWGSGGNDLDYNLVRKIVREEIKDAEKPEPDLKPVLEMLGHLQEAVEEIEIPEYEQESVDFAPVLSAVEQVKIALAGHVSSEVAGIEFPEQKELDLSWIGTMLEALKASIETGQTLSLAQKEEVLTAFKTSFVEMLAAEKEKAALVKEAIADWYVEKVEPTKPVPTPFTDFIKKRS